MDERNYFFAPSNMASVSDCEPRTEKSHRSRSKVVEAKRRIWSEVQAENLQTSIGHAHHDSEVPHFSKTHDNQDDQLSLLQTRVASFDEFLTSSLAHLEHPQRQEGAILSGSEPEYYRSEQQRRTTSFSLTLHVCQPVGDLWRRTFMILSF